MKWYFCLAERQGFEPWEGCPSTVFKTAAFDRSAISPIAKNVIVMTEILQLILYFIYVRKLDSPRYNDPNIPVRVVDATDTIYRCGL